MRDKHEKYTNNEGWLEASKELRNNPFSVPDDYFAGLEEITRFHTFGLANQFQEDETKANHSNGFEVPESYFSDLEIRIKQQLDATIEEETAAAEAYIFTHLNSRDNLNGFEVPNDYFEHAEQQILSKIDADQGESKVRTLKLERRNRAFPNWTKYAAAVVLLMVSFFFFMDNKPSDEQQDGLTAISDQEIINYLQFYADSRDVLLFSEYSDEDWEYNELDPELSSEDIKWFLENTL